jgi:lysozyme family protein
MADFLIAHKRTGRYEGGYANDPQDRGGETYKGIARIMHSKWPGWNIIDEYKRTFGPLKRGQTIPDPRLTELELQFYRTEFWNKIRGDEIFDQDIANMIYDDAVNAGPFPAVKKAQCAAFALTGNDIEKIKEANLLGIQYGRMDDKTINKLNNVT